MCLKDFLFIYSYYKEWSSQVKVFLVSLVKQEARSWKRETKSLVPSCGCFTTRTAFQDEFQTNPQTQTVLNSSYSLLTYSSY